jgi:threonine/homoserine/homoserine lactone efflux protein
MRQVTQYLALGIALGFGAGISPGPLLALVITASLRGGFRSGLRIACVPLLSDLPMVLACLTLVGALPNGALAWLAVGGGLLLGALGVQTIREARTAELPGPSDRGTDRTLVLRAIVANWVNPHPWLFWIGVGSPLLVSAWRETPVGATCFLVAFYLLIVATKVLLALLIGLSRGRLNRAWYRRSIAGSGVLLIAAGALLVAEFVGHLG